jgi:Na+/melibiose symporter-like transporter
MTSTSRNAGWPLWMYTAIILSIILIFPFILFERRLSLYERNDNNKGKRSQSVSKLPLMPLSLFKDRGFIIGTSIVLVFFIGSPVFIFILSFYLQNGLDLTPLTSGLTFLPMGIGILISSLITPKIVPKLDANILKIGALVIITGFGFLIIITGQQGNIGLNWSQLLPYLFIIGIGQGLVIVPLINVVLSHVKDQKHTGAVSGILSTMIQIGISIGIALIGSIFFGMVGSGYTTTHLHSYSNNLDNNVKIHYYNKALISSMIYTVIFVITTLFLVFLLPSRSHKEKNQQAKNT